jgi:hypothetical protein
VFTARYGLIPYIKQITFRLLKVNAHGREEVWLCPFLTSALYMRESASRSGSFTPYKSPPPNSYPRIGSCNGHQDSVEAVNKISNFFANKKLNDDSSYVQLTA